MTKEIRVPALGESVTEATIAKWFRQAGDAVKADEPLVEDNAPEPPIAPFPDIPAEMPGIELEHDETPAATSPKLTNSKDEQRSDSAGLNLARLFARLFRSHKLGCDGQT